MRTYLAKLDWNNMLRNKTAIECCTILKYEIESITVTPDILRAIIFEVSRRCITI